MPDASSICCGTFTRRKGTRSARESGRQMKDLQDFKLEKPAGHLAKHISVTSLEEVGGVE